MKPPIIRSAYTGRSRLSFETVGPSLTHQSMVPECDINGIMAKWQRTGVIEHRNSFEGQYGNFLETPSNYQDSMNAVLAAEEMFSSLPSSIRKRFANDPQNFLDFVSDASNADEMIKMGLASKVQQNDQVLENNEQNPKPKQQNQEPKPTSKTKETPPPTD